MNIKSKTAALMLVVLSSKTCLASDFKFSLGAGYPFFLVPGVSILAADQKQKWTFNYKAGLSDGFSLAYERSVSENDKHAAGIVIGTIGVIDDDEVCDELDMAVACIVANIFDEESVDGLAVSYNYYFSDIASRGLFIKMEAGWGESRETNQSESVGSIRIGYQF
jgi:hypothetical protein